MSNITVWTAPQCPNCTRTVDYFKGAGIQVDTRDLSAPENLSKLQELKDTGRREAPFVETPNDSWSGLRLDKMVQAVAVERASAPTPAPQQPGHTHDVSA